MANSPARTVFVSVCLAALFTPSAGRAQGAAGGEVLTNEAVVQMANGKIDKSMILKKISAQSNTFDITAKSLVGLYKNKVTAEVITAMMDAAKRPDSREVLTNDQIVYMSTNGLPEKLILKKILDTKSKFDLTTSGLLNLSANKVSKKITDAMWAASSSSETSSTPTPPSPPTPAAAPAASPTKTPAPTSTRGSTATPAPAASPTRGTGSAASVAQSAPKDTTDSNWKKNLEEALNKEFPPPVVQSGRGLRGSTLKEPGITLATQKNGVLANCEATILLLENFVRNGVITNERSSVKPGEAVLKAGTQARMHDVRVNDNDVVFRLETVEMFAADGRQWADLTGDQRDKAQKCQIAIRFQFDKDYLRTASVSAVKKQINSILASPEQAAAANQKTIQLGQTIAEVEKILGKPATVAKLGTKTIYTYKDMKVIFTNGKVTDVQ